MANSVKIYCEEIEMIDNESEECVIDSFPITMVNGEHIVLLPEECKKCFLGEIENQELIINKKPMEVMQ